MTLDDAASIQAILHYADRGNLARMKPHNVLSSTRYCLADPGNAYIVYQQTPGLKGNSRGFPFEVDLQAGAYDYEWLIPESNQITEIGEYRWEGGISTFTSPFNDHAVLFLKR